MVTGGISIAAFASGVGLPIGIVLSGTSVLLSLTTVITLKSFKTFTVKQEKHDSIKLLAQSKLDSIANIISHAIQDGDIFTTEFHKVLLEVENIANLRLILGTRLRPRQKRSHKNNEKNYLNREEKKERKVSYEKLQTLQLSRVSVPFKI